MQAFGSHPCSSPMLVTDQDDTVADGIPASQHMSFLLAPLAVSQFIHINHTERGHSEGPLIGEEWGNSG